MKKGGFQSIVFAWSVTAGLGILAFVLWRLEWPAFIVEDKMAVVLLAAATAVGVGYISFFGTFRLITQRKRFKC